MKIALYNIEYCTGIDGSILQYLLKFWRYMWSSGEILKKICGFLNKLKADVILLIESDGGSIRNRFKSQAEVISKKLGMPFCYSKCKYSPKSWLYKLPFFSNNHNSILSKEKGKVVTHYLSAGAKRLVQEYIADSISIFMVHLSLIRRIRVKQLMDLSRLLKKYPRLYIVCGDFNIFGGTEEISGFMKKNNLRLPYIKATYPSANPKQRLDLILVHRDIKIKSASAGNCRYSDHLPVVVEIGE